MFLQYQKGVSWALQGKSRGAVETSFSCCTDGVIYSDVETNRTRDSREDLGLERVAKEIKVIKDWIHQPQDKLF